MEMGPNDSDLLISTFMNDISVLNLEKNDKFNNETKSYEITLNIPKGINQFKFIVNDKWVCSTNYKIIND